MCVFPAPTYPVKNNFTQIRGKPITSQHQKNRTQKADAIMSQCHLRVSRSKLKWNITQWAFPKAFGHASSPRMSFMAFHNQLHFCLSAFSSGGRSIYIYIQYWICNTTFWFFLVFMCLGQLREMTGNGGGRERERERERERGWQQLFHIWMSKNDLTFIVWFVQMRTYINPNVSNNPRDIHNCIQSSAVALTSRRASDSEGESSSASRHAVSLEKEG